MIDSSIAYSFSQLIAIQKKKYETETIVVQKELIAQKFICDPNISKDILNIFSDMLIEDPKTDKERLEKIFNNFEGYYHTFRYSLSMLDNLKYYNVLKEYIIILKILLLNIQNFYPI